MDKFSAWLNQQIDKRGWSQSDLARASGLTRQVISYYLVGDSKSPNPDALHAIARAFKLPPEEVFRAAGILPPVSAKSAQISQMDHLLESLSEEDIEDLYAVAKAKLERLEEKAKQARIKKPAASASKP